MLKKNKCKKSKFLSEKENKWKENLSNLFDIAHMNVNKLIKFKKDREFFRLQRETRKGKILELDKIEKKRLELASKKQKSIEKLRNRQSSSINETVILESSTSSAPS